MKTSFGMKRILDKTSIEIKILFIESLQQTTN